jgi:hypothetical protein
MLDISRRSFLDGPECKLDFLFLSRSARNYANCLRTDPKVEHSQAFIDPDIQPRFMDSFSSEAELSTDP